MVNAPVEPSSDMRQVAHAVREMFIALVNEDFTEQQALQVIGIWIAAMMASGGNNG